MRHLTAEGCVLLREGSRHSWWQNPVRNRRSAVPRHSEIKDMAFTGLIWMRTSPFEVY